MQRKEFIKTAGILFAFFPLQNFGNKVKSIKMQQETKSLKYLVLDVFTKEKYKGNQLSVVLAEKELELPIYEAISREFGYSETSFIYYSKREKCLKVRSFTSTGFEIHGAGHNLLGVVCAVLLKKIDVFHEQQNEHFVLMKDHKIQLTIDYDQENELPIVSMKQQRAVIGKTISAEMIAKAISLDVSDVLIENFAPTVVSTEVTHLMVPIKNVRLLNKAVSNKPLSIKLAKEFGFEGVYCFAFTEKDPDNILQTRFFNPGIGIDEDPATGSAAGPLAGFLYHQKRVRLNTEYQLIQGAKMNQPSTIKFKVNQDSIIVSGSSVITMEGNLYL